MFKATITIAYPYSGAKQHHTFRATREAALVWVRNWQEHARENKAMSTYTIEAC